MHCHKMMPVGLKLKDLGVFGWAARVSHCGEHCLQSVWIGVFVRCCQQSVSRLLLI